MFTAFGVRLKPDLTVKDFAGGNFGHLTLIKRVLVRDRNNQWHLVITALHCLG